MLHKASLVISFVLLTSPSVTRGQQWDIDAGHHGRMSNGSPSSGSNYVKFASDGDRVVCSSENIVAMGDIADQPSALSSKACTEPAAKQTGVQAIRPRDISTITVTYPITSYVDLHTSCGIPRAKSIATIGTTTSLQTVIIDRWPTWGRTSSPSNTTTTTTTTRSIPVEECNASWNKFGLAAKSWTSNSVSQIWTLSLANPPSVIVVNGKTTTLVEGPVTTAPDITIGSRVVTPIVGWSNTRYDLGSFSQRISKSWIQAWEFGPISIEPGNQTVYTETMVRPMTPSCTPNLATGYSGECRIVASGAQLLYFPITSSVSRNMCATKPVEGPVTNLPTGVETSYLDASGVDKSALTVISGTTFDRRSAYLLFRSVSAVASNDNWQRDGPPIGSMYTSRLVPIASSRLFTIRRGVNESETRAVYRDDANPYSLNWADLNGPPPASAWFGMPICDFAPSSCQTIVDNEYSPTYVMPPEVRALDPNWAACDINYVGMNARHIALVPANNTAQSTASVPLATATNPPKPATHRAPNMPQETNSNLGGMKLPGQREPGQDGKRSRILRRKLSHV